MLKSREHTHGTCVTANRPPLVLVVQGEVAESQSRKDKKGLDHEKETPLLDLP